MSFKRDYGFHMTVIGAFKYLPTRHPPRPSLSLYTPPTLTLSISSLLPYTYTYTRTTSLAQVRCGKRHKNTPRFLETWSLTNYIAVGARNDDLVQEITYT